MRDLIVILITCKNEEDSIKNEGARVTTTFPHYMSMGAICCNGNQSSDAIWLNLNLMQPSSPSASLLQTKFDCNQRYSRLNVFKDARMDAGSILCYANISIFDSGELKNLYRSVSTAPGRVTVYSSTCTSWCYGGA